jgi:hypothetical protein
MHLAAKRHRKRDAPRVKGDFRQGAHPI